MKILLVDDSRTIRFMVSKMLNQLGYTDIIEAEDGEKAKQWVQQEKIDLILSDMNMPYTDGLSLLKWVRTRKTPAELPFIMVTTVHDRRIIIDAVKSGLNDYLLKPPDIAILCDKLRSIAKSHGLQPPTVTGEQSVASAQEAGAGVMSGEAASTDTASKGSNQRFSNELIKEITEHFFLVFDGELMMQDLIEWMAAKLSDAPPDKKDIAAAQELLEELRAAASQGMTDSLSKMKG